MPEQGVVEPTRRVGGRRALLGAALAAVILLGLGLWQRIGRRSGASALSEDAAPARLERLLERDPRHVPARLDLAAARAAEHNWFGAIEQLEAARSLGHREELLYRRLAELYRTVGDYRAAAETLEEGVRAGYETLRFDASAARAALGEFRRAAAIVLPLAGRKELPEPLRRRVARDLMLAGRWEAARRLLPLAARDPEWLSLQGYLSYLSAQPDAAVRSLRAAVERAPGDTWNRFLLGQAALAAGARQEALRAWLAAAHEGDAPVRAGTGAARLLAESGEADRAAALLDRIRAEGETDPDYWRVRALLEARAGRPARAALARGRSLACAGDPWEAERLYLRAAARAGEDARDLLAEAVASAERRFDSVAALDLALKALARWPRDPGLLRRAAELLLEQNRYQEAERLAVRLESVAGPPEMPEVADLRARIALEAGSAAAVRRAVERYRLLAPERAEPFLLLAEWHQTRDQAAGRLDRAVEHCREATRRAPDNAEAWARLGALLAELKRYDEAREPLLRALSLSPWVMDGVPCVHLARMNRLRGCSLEAAYYEHRYRVVRAAKDAFVTFLPAMRGAAPAADLRALGEAALARNERWVALWAFRRAARLEPGEPSAWEGVAAAERRLGRFEEAVRAMRRAWLLSSGAAGRRGRG